MAKFNRDKAIIRLRKAAEKAKSWGWPHDLERLESAWRAFPENYRDGLPTPAPREILKICDRMDRELEEQRNFEAAMKIGK